MIPFLKITKGGVLAILLTATLFFNPAINMASGDVTWNNTQNATIAGDDIHHSLGGYWFNANSDQAINPSNNAYFEFILDDDGGTNDIYVHLIDAATAPYSASPSPTSGFRLSHGIYPQYWNGSGWTAIGYPSGGGAGVTLRMGFDGAGHLTLWDATNGVYFTSTETVSGDHILYPLAGNDGGVAGLLNVKYDDGAGGGGPIYLPEPSRMHAHLAQ